MNAHGKIYMPNELLSEDWTRHIEGQDTAYIREDVILEWAREKKDKAGIGLSEYDAGHENGTCEIINELVEKLSRL